MKSLFGMKLISWTAAPANAGTLSFRRGETGRRLLVKDDGIYPAPRGFIMIVRWPVERAASPFTKVLATRWQRVVLRHRHPPLPCPCVSRPRLRVERRGVRYCSQMTIATNHRMELPQTTERNCHKQPNGVATNNRTVDVSEKM